MDIDLVYLWVNGNDPKWRAKRDACIGKPVDGSGVNCEGRYADHDELKYSLRSVEKYAPWLRKIFIVSDNQVPSWLDTTNPKIQIVDHTEILPAKSLPCFNANVLEHHLHKIPGLSEHFLFANDDMYLNQPVTPSTFFAEDGLPIIRQNLRLFKRLELFYKEKLLGKTLDNYKQIVRNAALLVEKKFGTYYGSKGHHNIDSYLKSHYAHVREMFKDEIDATLENHMRAGNDIQRNLYSYVAQAEKMGHVQYVTQKTSLRFQIHKHKNYVKFKNGSIVFFCMNDSQFACEEDRKLAAAFLEERFPEKSQFEK